MSFLKQFASKQAVLPEAQKLARKFNPGTKAMWGALRELTEAAKTETHEPLRNEYETTAREIKKRLEELEKIIGKLGGW